MRSAVVAELRQAIEDTVQGNLDKVKQQAMIPKLHSKNFEGMELIRPMYCINEEDILAWKRYNDLEFIQCACRFTENCTICDNGGGGSKRQGADRACGCKSGASCACPALAHPCASVAEFDERLWGAMVDYVAVGVDKRLMVMFRDGSGV